MPPNHYCAREKTLGQTCLVHYSIGPLQKREGEITGFTQFTFMDSVENFHPTFPENLPHDVRCL